MNRPFPSPLGPVAPAESEVGLRGAPRDPVPYVNEIRELPARLVPNLPLGVTLWLRVPGAPVPVCFTTAVASGEPQPVLGSHVVFDRDEIAALVVGVEADRVWCRELLGMCFDKWRRPALRIVAADTLAGALPDATETWSLECVLRRLGATLVHVELTGDAAVAPRVPIAA